MEEFYPHCYLFLYLKVCIDTIENNVNHDAGCKIGLIKWNITNERYNERNTYFFRRKKDVFVLENSY